MVFSIRKLCYDLSDRESVGFTAEQSGISVDYNRVDAFFLERIVVGNSFPPSDNFSQPFFLRLIAEIFYAQFYGKPGGNFKLGFRFTEGISLNFAGGAAAELAPWESVVVVRDLAAFRGPGGGPGLCHRGFGGSGRRPGNHEAPADHGPRFGKASGPGAS